MPDEAAEEGMMKTMATVSGLSVARRPGGRVWRPVLSAVMAAVVACGTGWGQDPLILQDGTPVKLRLGENLSSETARVGDTVSFEVLEDVEAGGLIVIKQGSAALATITQAQAKRRMGKGGKLDVNIDYVRLVTGEKAPLRAVRENKGASSTGGMTAGIVATSIVFFPAAPFFLFMKGKEVTIPKGTEVMSYVHSDVRLDAARLRAAAPNIGSAPAVAAAPAQGQAAAPAQQAAPAPAPAPRGGMTNNDVLELRKAGFSEDLIITKINSSTCSFRMETQDMIDLKRAGLSDKVIAAMMAKMK
ncbi:MAG: PEGA domain-containing protein [Candidatus Solibacter sp.]|nr:PEGA domain-containing protein [Candidatus Solibacter sp.]